MVSASPPDFLSPSFLYLERSVVRSVCKSTTVLGHALRFPAA